jgi:lipid A ethanolaminephosphotransferase
MHVFRRLTAVFKPAPDSRGWHPALVITLVCLWMATVANAPLWRELASLPELQTGRGLLFAMGFAILITSTLVALATLMAWGATLIRSFLTLSLISAAFCAHFMWAYSIVIDTSMMVNVLHTDPRETRDLLSVPMLTTVLLLAALPAWWVWRVPLLPLPWKRRMAHNLGLLGVALLVLTAVVFLIFQDFASVMRNHKHVRFLINPLNAYYALGSATLGERKASRRERVSIGEDAQPGPMLNRAPRPPLVVLVLGETARSANFGINGYERPTTPRLATQEIASFTNAWSCGTNTAASVPCMFSHLEKQAFEDRKVDYDNLLDVAARAGWKVLWIDNQSGCKGVCDRQASVSTAQESHPTLCTSGECHDEIMLQGLDARITALTAGSPQAPVLIVMHQMGSHGPAYFKRTPQAFKHFQPECTSNALQECGRDKVRNAYDNTIRYTDHFLAETIAWLARRSTDRPAAMVYVSDHGESLGENNLYLHGLPYAIAPDTQKHIPWVTWLSPQFQSAMGIGLVCLRTQAARKLSHDNYFHSVLGLLDVTTAARNPALDVYGGCRQPR